MPHLKSEKATARAGPAIVGGKEHGTIVACSRVDIQIGLNLVCMKITPKAKERYSSSHDPYNRFRNVELMETFHEFVGEVLAKRLKENEFEEFRKAREQMKRAYSKSAKL
jgi:hypothetical protein